LPSLPFTLAYDAYFNDCDIALVYIYSLLKEWGGNQTANVEFFEIPTRKAIDAVKRTEAKYPLLYFDNSDDRNQSDKACSDFLFLDSETKMAGKNINEGRSMPALEFKILNMTADNKKTGTPYAKKQINFKSKMSKSLSAFLINFPIFFVEFVKIINSILSILFKIIWILIDILLKVLLKMI
jgi:hypothetical protein